MDSITENWIGLLGRIRDGSDGATQREFVSVLCSSRTHLSRLVRPGFVSRSLREKLTKSSSLVSGL
jgi:hypothetical protein